MYEIPVLTPELLERIADCFEKASRVNPDSIHRKELKKILRDYDLDVARRLLDSPV